MNKILVTIYVIFLDNQYDVLIPINISVKDALELIQNSIVELSSKAYVVNPNALLYDESGKIINTHNIVKFSGLKNGSKVILM